MSADLTVPPHLLTPRDWQASAQLEASDLLGSPEGAAKLAEARRYGALADHIASLQARLDAAERALRTCIDYFDDNWRNIAGADADIARAEAIAATQEKP